MSLLLVIYLAQRIFLDCNQKGSAGSLPRFSSRFNPLCHWTLANNLLLVNARKVMLLRIAQNPATSLCFKAGCGFWVPALHTDAFLSLARYSISMLFYLFNMCKSEMLSRYSQNTGLGTVPAVFWMRKRCWVRSIVNICIISRVIRVIRAKSGQTANLRKHTVSPGFMPLYIPGMS